MRIPIRRGRDFTPFDGPNSVPVAIINDTMAREIFLLSGFALLASTHAIVGA